MFCFFVFFLYEEAVSAVVDMGVMLSHTATLNRAGTRVLMAK